MTAVTQFTGALRHPFSFDANSAKIANASHGMETTPLVYEQASHTPPESTVALGTNLELDINALLKYLKEPSNSYLVARLGFPHPEWVPGPLSDVEPFGQDPLNSSIHRRKIGMLIRDSEEHTDELEMMYSAFRASCELPLYALGSVEFGSEVEQSVIKDTTFRAEWCCQAPGECRCTLEDVPLELPTELKNELDAVTGTAPKCVSGAVSVTLKDEFEYSGDFGIREVFFSKTLGHNLIGAYLRYLVLCASHPSSQMNAKWLWDGGVKIEVPNIAPEAAEQKLKDIVTLYLVGQRRPLPLFGRFSPEAAIWLARNPEKRSLEAGAPNNERVPASFWHSLERQDFSDASISLLYGAPDATFKRAWFEVLCRFSLHCYGAIGTGKQSGAARVRGRRR